jgi:hypothetical protein
MPPLSPSATGMPQRHSASAGPTHDLPRSRLGARGHSRSRRYTPSMAVATRDVRRFVYERRRVAATPVDQIFAGRGPAFNAGQRVEAYTSALWVEELVAGRATLGTFMGIPVASEIFRMGYYATLVANTALEKDAGSLHVRQGGRTSTTSCMRTSCGFRSRSSRSSSRWACERHETGRIPSSGQRCSSQPRSTRCTSSSPAAITRTVASSCPRCSPSPFPAGSCYGLAHT